MSVLVFSAHGFDYLWRAGGTIASYVAKKERVHIVCLTLGERGESHGLWKSNPNISVEEVKQIRLEETKAAAAALGATVEVLDFDDNPLEMDKQRFETLIRIIRRERPRIIITHQPASSTNPDHRDSGEFTLRAIRYASLPGVLPDVPTNPRPQVFVYEHMHPEFDSFKPLCYVDITAVHDVKTEAMKKVVTQAALCKNYTLKAEYRAWQARDIYGIASIQYAECFQPETPFIGDVLPEQSPDYIGGTVKHS